MEDTIKEIEKHLNRIKEITAEFNRMAEESRKITESHSAKGCPKPRKVYY